MLSNEVVEALLLKGFKRGRCHYYSLLFAFCLALCLLGSRAAFSKGLFLTTCLCHFASLRIRPI